MGCVGADKHLTAKMGLFEEIERAWFTVDNKLFLWDYADGWVGKHDTLASEILKGSMDHSRDFSRYDEQAETIQSVGLVKARRGELGGT